MDSQGQETAGSHDYYRYPNYAKYIPKQIMGILKTAIFTRNGKLKDL